MEFGQPLQNSEIGPISPREDYKSHFTVGSKGHMNPSRDGNYIKLTVLKLGCASVMSLLLLMSLKGKIGWV